MKGEQMKLFEPYNIGKMALKNRLVLAPMSTNMTDNGFVTQGAINFYEARAKGGVGLITCEDGIIEYPLGNNVKNPVAIDDDKYIPMLTRLNETIHAYDAKTIMQLSHGGRRAGRVAKSGCLEVTRGKIPVGPTSLAHPAPGYVVPEELTKDQIEQIIEKFGNAARRAIEAGFDAIGVHCAHMYLCGEFLSPWANHRTDEYGGSFEGRLRFVLEAIARIRKEIGSDYPIIPRINGQEPRGGNTLEDIRKIAQALEKAGADAIHVSVGFAATIKDPEFIPSIPSMRFPDGPIVHLAENVKKGVRIPVIAVSKIRDAMFAEKILQEGKADLIAMGRTLIADPDFPNKSREGKYDDVRPCISCCQGCINRVMADLPLKCSVNPMVGREGELIIENAKAPKKVIIIGGGPGGLETALIAARRGHHTVLYEKQERLGGQLMDAALPPFKSEINKLTNFYISQIKKSNISVKLNTFVTPEMIKGECPDAVIVAAGAEPLLPPIPGIEMGQVVTAVDVLRDKVKTGRKIVIIGAGQLGLETAEFLGERGKEVTIVEMTGDIGTGMPSQIKMPLLFSLEKYGVEILTQAKAERITRGAVEISQGVEKKVIPADTVVLAVGYKANQTLMESYKGTAPDVYFIGNCINPGNIIDAVNQGFEAAVKL
ncbi:MAG TPA: NADH:flavin oxidoreductase [Syntrophaceae bacterium]|nr:NADH:flavin oxidoreductase [Syntrophaceae bacterium]